MPRHHENDGQEQEGVADSVSISAHTFVFVIVQRFDYAAKHSATVVWVLDCI